MGKTPHFHSLGRFIPQRVSPFKLVPFPYLVLPERVEVEIMRVEEHKAVEVEESELDEMWSYVGKKSNPRWLWQRIDRSTGQVLAYVLSR